MKNKKLHVPAGLRNILPEEFKKKQYIENKISSVFDANAFCQISSPTFEYIEVFENSGNKNYLYKFIDREGEILTLRPDMTPAISRIVATNYSKNEFPLRLSYIQTAFRNNEGYQGKLSEFTQAGVELIGAKGERADTQVIALAIDALKSTNLKDFCIDIGHVGFLSNVLKSANLEEETQKQIQHSISMHDFVSLDKIVLQNPQIPERTRKMLSTLSKSVGKIDVIQNARRLIDDAQALKALDEIEKVYNHICQYEMQDYVRIDLGMTQKFDYYTGILFKGYTAGTGFWLLDGGRYDDLVKNYGLDAPCVGFGISIENLLLALEKQKHSFEQNKVDTLICYGDQNQKQAIEKACQLRSEGKIVELSTIDPSTDDNRQNELYAKRKNIKEIIKL